MYTSTNVSKSVCPYVCPYVRMYVTLGLQANKQTIFLVLTNNQQISQYLLPLFDDIIKSIIDLVEACTGKTEVCGLGN